MKNITINFKNSTIELSKATAKAASVFGSQEYKDLIEACSQFPSFRVVVQKTAKRKKKVNEENNENKENKMNMKGLNYDFMKHYIKTHSDSETHMAEFEKLKESKVSYFDVKNWFFETYHIFKDDSKSIVDCILAA